MALSMAGGRHADGDSGHETHIGLSCTGLYRTNPHRLTSLLHRLQQGHVKKFSTAIGLISDTHGLLREEAVRALHGSDLIIHAGDIGKPEILHALKKIAPVVAVTGNIEQGASAPAWARELPATAVAEAGPVTIYVIHDLHMLEVGSRRCWISNRGQRALASAIAHGA